MSAPRVRVRRSPRDLDDPSGLPWLAELNDGETIVGRFASMPEAVRTGVTAARFVAAGVPWRPVNVPDPATLFGAA